MSFEREHRAAAEIEMQQRALLEEQVREEDGEEEAPEAPADEEETT
jgi:hypothetical protein